MGGSRKRSGTFRYSPCCSWVKSHAESSTIERRTTVARRLPGLPRRRRSAVGRGKPACVGVLMWTPVLFPQGDGEKRPTAQDSLQGDGQHGHAGPASSLGHLLILVQPLSSRRRGPRFPSLVGVLRSPMVHGAAKK